MKKIKNEKFENVEKNKNSFKIIDKIDIAIFLTIIILFGTVLLSFFPAILTSDSVDQMNQAETRKL